MLFLKWSISPYVETLSYKDIVWADYYENLNVAVLGIHKKLE